MRRPVQAKPVDRQANLTCSIEEKGLTQSDCCGPGKCCIGGAFWKLRGTVHSEYRPVLTSAPSANEQFGPASRFDRVICGAQCIPIRSVRMYVVCRFRLGRLQNCF